MWGRHGGRVQVASPNIDIVRERERECVCVCACVCKGEGDQNREEAGPRGGTGAPTFAANFGEVRKRLPGNCTQKRALLYVERPPFR